MALFYVFSPSTFLMVLEKEIATNKGGLWGISSRMRTTRLHIVTFKFIDCIKHMQVFGWRWSSHGGSRTKAANAAQNVWTSEYICFPYYRLSKAHWFTTCKGTTKKLNEINEHTAF